MNREVMDRWCERGILGLVLGILVFGPLATGAVRTLEFLIIQGMTLGVMLLWGARVWLAPQPRLLWPPICWAVLAFCLYAIGRYLTADIEYAAREELIRVLIYTFLFFAIVNNLQRQESIQLITITLIFLAMAISFYAIYQFITGSDRVWHFRKPYHHRGSGTYISPNHLGGFLEMLLPLGLAYTLTSRLKAVGKVFIGYAALVMLVGIAVTLSRGSWISTAAALLVFFGVLLFQRMHRLPSLVLLALLIGGSCYFVPKSDFFQTRAKALFGKGGGVDDDVRFALWQPAVELWKENVWWGIGPAHFDSRFRAHRPQEIQMRPQRVHNDYLNTLVDWGVVGSALVAAALGLFVWGILKTWRFLPGNSSAEPRGNRSNRFAFVLGASAGLLAILLHSPVVFNMHIPANAILAVALMAMLRSCLRFAIEGYWIELGPGKKAMASEALLVGLVYLGQQGWQRATEYVWLNRAARASRFSPAQVELLKKAFAAEPKNPDTAYAVGEALRRQSQEGGDSYRNMEGVDYRKLAEEAMEWFGRSQKLNPWDGYSFLAYGWCLDWVDRKAEAGAYFDRAEQLDPNGYFTMASIGLHYVELGNYAAAKSWFERSFRLQQKDNIIAQDYLEITKRRMLEAATNEITAKLNLPAR